MISRPIGAYALMIIYMTVFIKMLALLLELMLQSFKFYQ